MSASNTDRDLRVDFLRGAALLFILWDHILQMPHADAPFFLRITPVFWGISSALAIFVFLSGYVYGRVYRKRVQRKGLGRAFVKSYDRAWELMVVNLFTMLVAVGVLGGLDLITGTTIATNPYNLGALFELSATEAWHLLTLRFFPGPFAVLPLYIVLLLLVPLMLVLLRWHPAAALAASAVLYIAAQVGLTLPAPLMLCCDGEWPFNPFAWQFLFVIGVLLGWYRPRVLRLGWARAALAVVVLVAIKVWMLGRLARHGVPIPDELLASVPAAEKASLGPVRLGYFLVLAYATAYYTQPLRQALRSSARWAAVARVAWVRPGQYSLTVYAAGMVFQMGAHEALRLQSAHWLFTGAAITLGWLASMGVAVVVHHRRQLTAPSSSAPSSSRTPQAPHTPSTIANGSTAHDPK